MILYAVAKLMKRENEREIKLADNQKKSETGRHREINNAIE